MAVEEALVMDEKDMETHRKLAAEAFNRAWELMDKRDRTDAEAVEMVHAAHASRFHWGKVGTPLNLERGDWQLSRVYAVLGQAARALEYAERCLETCEREGIADFDIAFAYEGMARAHALASRSADATRFMRLARKAAEGIKEKDDRDYFMGELKTVPGHND